MDIIKLPLTQCRYCIALCHRYVMSDSQASKLVTWPSLPLVAKHNYKMDTAHESVVWPRESKWMLFGVRGGNL